MMLDVMIDVSVDDSAIAFAGEVSEGSREVGRRAQIKRRRKLEKGKSIVATLFFFPHLQILDYCR